MNSPNGFLKKTIDLGGRYFSLQILKFENGSFVSLSEGINKIGSMVVSLNMGQNPVTTTVIPSKEDSVFLKLIAEKICYKMNGIAIVSAFIKKEIDSETAKVLIAEISDMIEN